jgi:hypothetical protein
MPQIYVAMLPMPVLLLLTSSCMTLDQRCLQQHIWALDVLK